MEDSGELFVIGLPIGNYKDITLRALDTLKEVDGILCEDTRKTGRLLKEYDIKSNLVSFHAHNQKGKLDIAIEKLLKGEKWAIISDGGTPCISDPGTLLVKEAIDMGIKIVPLPGASALNVSMSVCGFPPYPTIFLGFLSPKSGRRKKELMKWNMPDLLVVVFESPYRIIRLLEDALEVFGNCMVFIGREMTKIHENFYKDRVEVLIEYWQKNKPRGEFTLIFWPNG